MWTAQQPGSMGRADLLLYAAMVRDGEVKKGWIVMSNLLSYKNYNGTVEYSKEDNCLFGKVVGIKSLLSYEGDSVQELEQDFQNVIDEYLEDCKERSVEPKQP